MSLANALQRISQLSVATLQLMCLVHVVNQYVLEVRSVRGALLTTVHRRLDAPDVVHVG